MLGADIESSPRRGYSICRLDLTIRRLTFQRFGISACVTQVYLIEVEEEIDQLFLRDHAISMKLETLPECSLLRLLIRHTSNIVKVHAR